MATIEFLLKHCPMGRMLLERFSHQHVPVAEWRELFEETRSGGQLFAEK